MAGSGRNNNDYNDLRNMEQAKEKDESTSDD
jgi:hypothetical protein